MKHSFYLISAAVSVFLLVCATAFVNGKNQVPDKHLEVVLRNIGHQLLLRSNDSVSRVMPVKRVDERTYEISFENNFWFSPDTLMKLVSGELRRTSMPKDYFVSVNDCHEPGTVFAFEINSTDGDLRPCKGRIQRSGCYVIRIEFPGNSGFNYTWSLLALIPLTLLGIFFYRRKSRGARADQPSTMDETVEPSPGENEKVPEPPEYIQLGSFRFSETGGTLSNDNATIELSDKEVKALSIFASSQNLVVERDRLMKAIWEDEGVVVIPRNVDVLVSKIRKKFNGDLSVRIVNVHGKGYKMIIDN